MIETEIEAARDEVRAHVAMATLTLGQRALLLCLTDALDRLRTLLSHPAWQGSGKLPPALVHSGAAALAELNDALVAAEPVMDGATSRRIGLVVVELQCLIAARSRRTRSQGATLGAAPPAPAVEPPPGMAPLAEAATARPVPDHARFGASAPCAVSAGSSFVARFVAYAQGQRDRAQELLADHRSQTEVGAVPLAHGTHVKVALSGAGLVVEGEPRSVQSFEWTGEPVVLTWAVDAVGAAGSATLLRFDVMVDGLVLARVRLELDIVADAPKAPAQVSGECSIARKAFASYSSKDRLRVLDRVASIRLAAAVEVFLDCHDLNPGEAWQPRLQREIDGCDTFMLFWSASAAMSEWVRWEWERALAMHGLEHMQFHPLENGVRPPEALSAIHVGDPYVDLRMAERLRRATTST